MKVFPRFFFFLTILLLTFSIQPKRTKAQIAVQDSALKYNPFYTIQVLSSDSLFGRSLYGNGKQKALRFLTQQIQTVADSSLTLRLSTAMTQLNDIQECELRSDNRIFTLGEDYLPNGDTPSFQNNIALTRLSAKIPSQLTHVGVIISSQQRKNRPQLIDSLLKTDCAFIIIEAEQLYFSPSYQQIEKPIITIKNNAFDNIDSIQISIKATLIKYPIENLIAIRGDTLSKNKALTFMAHYDHLGTIAKKHIFNGANDNASGVATALSLFFNLPTTKFPIQLILTDAEELGLLGAYTVLQNNTLFPISYLINLDMTASGNGFGIVGAESDSLLISNIRSIAKSNNIDITFRKNTPNSDHYPFLESGITGFYLYTKDGTQPYHSHLDDFATINTKLLIETLSFLNEFCLSLNY